MRWFFDSFRFKNEFPEFIPSLALVSAISAASKSELQSVEKSQWRNRFVDNIAVRNVRPGQKRHLFPPAVRIYTCFQNGWYIDACFIDRGASCLFSLAISPKARANVCFFMVWFSPGVPSARKVINLITFIYSKHDALRSTKQGSCIMHHWSNLN